MSDSATHIDDLSPQLRAAITLWEPLAAYAWEQTLTFGRGVVVLQQDEMMDAAEAMREGQPISLTPGFVPMQEVPSGDDFLQIIAGYDVKKQIVLLIGRSDRDGAEDDEQLIVLEANESGRPLPEECFYARQEQA